VTNATLQLSSFPFCYPCFFFHTPSFSPRLLLSTSFLTFRPLSFTFFFSFFPSFENQLSHKRLRLDDGGFPHVDEFFFYCR